ncbi:MAG: sugar ABC transporter ATP-binding protein [Acetobacteraceae bacterium]|nr:sugar ABC transporter ATP-binding protein [Acetobacteraceae bacterium]
MTTPILELTGISKTFGATKALDGARLELYPGEVTALIGENGAGKSTLVKIITGIQPPTSGEMRLDGKPLRVRNPEEAFAAGITAIYQETVLFDELSIAENIFLGHEPRRAGGLIDWPTVFARSRELLARLEIDLDPRTILKNLSIAQRHIVGIARALSIDARIVIMDEPTAALSRHEIEDLYGIVRGLAAEGKAILFITHKFDEIFAICDRYAVFRDGRFIGEGLIRDVDQDRLVSMMVGRSVEQIYPKRPVQLGDVVLEVEDLSHPTEFEDISFTLRKGEILGFYGLVGAGRSEVMQALFGLTRPSHGVLRIEGQEVRFASPREAVRAGIVYVPEERGSQGLVLQLPIVQNMSLPQLDRLTRRGFIDMASEFALARQYGERLQVKTASWSEPVDSLSGGNQQKVVIGKWLATQPKVIILDEPTKGIDVGAKAAVHEFTVELAERGLAVIMVSSELPEVIGMSDRIVVMHEGHIRQVFSREEATPEAIVTAATGAAAPAARALHHAA